MNYHEPVGLFTSTEITPYARINARNVCEAEKVVQCVELNII